MIRTNNLVKVYRTEEVETTALNEVSIEIKQGEFVSIMGPSGCGKSTLLNLLGMIDSPSKGEYFFMDEEVGNLPERKRSNVRKHNLGFVFQSFNLIDELTVFENVELPLILNKIDKDERRSMIEQAVESVGLTDKMDSRPNMLSGGECQRTAIARAIVHQPALVLADEPTANLDAENSHHIMKILVRLNQELSTSFIFATHDEKIMAYLRRIIHLDDGEITEDENISNPKTGN